MRYNRPRMLTPPREEEEVYPYRRAWGSIVREIGILTVISAGFYALGVVGFVIPERIFAPLNFTLPLLTVGLWLYFSAWKESRVQEPRVQLVAVMVVSALVANAIGVPLIGALRPDDWLASAGSFERILGYALTVGLVQEGLKYGVLRVILWQEGFRNRLDTLAYATAAAVGYATVTNLHLLADGLISPDVLALRLYTNVIMHYASSAILAYGLSELRFNPQVFFIMPVMIFMSALVTGATISIRATLTNSGFVLGIGGTRPLLGFVFSVVLVVTVLFLTAFLYNNAERREREAVEGD
ncbi:MAG: PrsW family glutamic-type intramembrane protease [Phototrophicales bacterium]|nr:PrsW family glutamic-type intramembrane protease [Phototrophicales bacterium]